MIESEFPQDSKTGEGLSRRAFLTQVSAGAALATGTGLAADRGHANTDGILAYETLGSGSHKVIFLHDWSASAEMDYAFAKPFLDASQMTMAFADVRGYGGSITMSGRFDSDEIAQDVGRLADHLGWDRFSVAGHSMTGMAVQKIMARMPERLEKVVATVPVPASGFPLDEGTFAFFESMATDDGAYQAGMHALTSERYGQAWVNFKLAQNRASVSPEAMAAYTSMWSKEDFSSVNRRVKWVHVAA